MKGIANLAVLILPIIRNQLREGKKEKRDYINHI